MVCSGFYKYLSHIARRKIYISEANLKKVLDTFIIVLMLSDNKMTILFQKTMFKAHKTVQKRTGFATKNKGKQAIPKI